MQNAYNTIDYKHVKSSGNMRNAIRYFTVWHSRVNDEEADDYKKESKNIVINAHWDRVISK